MMETLHIFDIDGTVLDSMPMWENLPFLYLDSLGIEAPSNLAEIIDPLTVPETNRYIAETFNVPGGEDAVSTGIHEVLRDQYANVLEPFDDILPELDALLADGARMVVFSNTPHVWLDLALERCDLMKYFERVFSVEDIGIRKDYKESFLKVCEIMGTPAESSIVYDDSKYALDAAEAAGCVIKKYDRYRGVK